MIRFGIFKESLYKKAFKKIFSCEQKNVLIVGL